jgi:membrane fusion protein, multidrug efflux system
VVKPDDTVDIRTVELGPIDDGLRVVKSGIKVEDRVVVEGLQRVRVGGKVAPKAAGEKEAVR